MRDDIDGQPHQSWPCWRRGVAAWCSIGLIATLPACSTERDPRLRAEDWATVTTREHQVTALQTQLDELEALIDASTPTSDPVDFAAVWQVEVTGREHAAEYPRLTPSASGREALQARGQFLALRLTVVNLSNRPAKSFPWWDLRLADGTGRIYSPDLPATESYMLTQSTIREDKPAAFQPDLTVRGDERMAEPCTQGNRIWS